MRGDVIGQEKSNVICKGQADDPNLPIGLLMRSRRVFLFYILFVIGLRLSFLHSGTVSSLRTALRGIGFRVVEGFAVAHQQSLSFVSALCLPCVASQKTYPEKDVGVVK